MELDFIAAKKLIQERGNQILYGAIFRYKPNPLALSEFSFFIKPFFFLFRILRYEEFALNIWEQTNLLYDFLGLPLSMETKEFLLNHTQSERSFQLSEKLILAMSCEKKNIAISCLEIAILIPSGNVYSLYL